jgi:hypothetical protein
MTLTDRPDKASSVVEDRAGGEGKTNMRIAVGIAAVLFAAGALAQTAAPPPPAQSGAKPTAQAKTQAFMGCKLVGTVKGTKIWAGNCTDAAAAPVAAEPEKPALTDRASGAIPPNQKQPR